MKKLLILPVIFFCQPVFCQNAVVKSNDIAIVKAIDTYYNTINVQSGLYNGVEYSGYLPGLEGHPYYNSGDWLKGSVFYDGILYPEVFLKYDIYIDKLIVKRFDGFAIELLNEKLNYFVIGTDLFTHFFDNRVLNAGYYQALYTGNLSVYAKKTKLIQDKRNENNSEQIFEEKDKYFAIKGAEVVVIKNLSSIINLMNDKQKKAQQYLKQNNISFKKNPEAAMFKIAEYYNQVNKN